MSRDELIDHYLERSHEPDFEITVVRKELEQQQTSEEDIREIVRIVDNEIQNRAISDPKRKMRNSLFWAGIFVSIVAIGLNISAWMGWMETKYPLFVLYGPLILGMGLMYMVKKRK